MINTIIYNPNSKFVGVLLENSVNGSKIIIPREEIISITRRMLAIYENTKQENPTSKI